MKLNFSLKNKEIGLYADVEGMIENSLNYKKDKPAKKTRYQIKQEELRKNNEQKFKHNLITVIGLAILMVFLILMCLIFSALGIE